MAALRVADVNLHRRRLDVRQAVAEVRGELVYSTPKSHERRSVPYPAFLNDDIANLVDGKRGDDLIFTGPKGAPLRVSDFRPRHFLPAVARCQAADPTSPTSARTRCGTRPRPWTISASANVKAVKTMLGYKPAAMHWTPVPTYSRTTRITSPQRRTTPPAAFHRPPPAKPDTRAHPDLIAVGSHDASPAKGHSINARRPISTALEMITEIPMNHGLSPRSGAHKRS